jgi:hypothetical protein
MRQTFAWESIVRGRNRRRAYIPLNVTPGDGRNDPQLDWDIDGSIIVQRTGTKIFKGVVLIDALDVENANYNGWFVQPRATTLREKTQGLVRVCRL